MAAWRLDVRIVGDVANFVWTWSQVEEFSSCVGGRHNAACRHSGSQLCRGRRQRRFSWSNLRETQRSSRRLESLLSRILMGRDGVHGISGQSERDGLLNAQLIDTLQHTRPLIDHPGLAGPSFA